MTSGINFVIFSPFETYVDYIGGATVPHTLAHKLSLFGENVYVYANSTYVKYDRVQCIPYGTDVKFDERNTIVVFIAGAGEHTWEHKVPSCLMNAPNIVRWLVNDQVKPYPTDDKFYMYHKYWRVLDGQRIDGDLSVIEIDHTLFCNKQLPRSGSCYLIKGNLDTESSRIVHQPTDLCIDTVLYTVPDKMQFYSDLFNQKEYFISYTPFTFTSVLAAMCGCKSIVIPKTEYGGVAFNKQKWLDEIWCAKYGIAVGMDDLPRAIDTLDLVVPNVKSYEEITQTNQIKQFITDCYEWLSIKYNI